MREAGSRKIRIVDGYFARATRALRPSRTNLSPHAAISLAERRTPPKAIAIVSILVFIASPVVFPLYRPGRASSQIGFASGFLHFHHCFPTSVTTSRPNELQNVYA